MTSKEKFLLWFRVVWALLLAGSLTYYLVRAWRRKVVTMVGSYGTRAISRASYAGWYYRVMIFYFIVDVFFWTLLFVSVRQLLKRTG